MLYIEYWLPGALLAVSACLAAIVYAALRTVRIRKNAHLLRSVCRRISSDGSAAESTEQTVRRIGDAVSESGSDALSTCWSRFSGDISGLFGGKIAPEPAGYFAYENVFTRVPGSGFPWGWVCGFAVPALLAAPVEMLLRGAASDNALLQLCVGTSLLCLLVIATVCSIAFFALRRQEDAAHAELSAFQRRLTALLPTADSAAQAALLLESSRQNAAAFVQTADRIAQKIDDFAVSGITPAVASAFAGAIRDHIAPPVNELQAVLTELSNRVTKRQEDGLNELVSAFSDKLEGSVTQRMNALGDSVSAMTDALSAFQNEFQKLLTAAEQQTSADRELLRHAAETLDKNAVEQQVSVRAIGEVGAALTRTEALMQQAAEHNGTVFARLELSSAEIKELQTALADSLNRVDSAREATVAAMQKAASDFSAGVNALVEKTGSSVGAVFAESSRQLSETVAGAAEANAKASADLNASLAAYSEHFTASLTGAAEANAKAAADLNASLSAHSDRFNESLAQAYDANRQTAESLAKTMDSLANAGSEQYEKAAQAAAQLLDNVVAEMNKAMDGVGREIAESITKASADSAAIVDRLAEKTEHLKEEYDEFFTRVETQSSDSISEMDFHMQNVFSRFAEEAGGVMDKLEANISKAMELFTGNTDQLLQSLDEQARSIGLYAKSLNIDVDALSTNLRESVGIFSAQLSESTTKTFAEFDGGLAEMLERFSVTIESIRESVEQLPKALSAQKQ